MSHSFNLNLLSESVDQVHKTNVNDLFMNQTVSVIDDRNEFLCELFLLN